MLPKLFKKLCSIKNDIFGSKDKNEVNLENNNIGLTSYWHQYPKKFGKFVSSPKFNFSDIGYTINPVPNISSAFKINAIHIQTLEDKIEYANNIFANEHELLNAIRIFYGSNNHKITDTNYLMDDHVQYWLKLLVRAYRNGAQTAFTEVYAFQNSINDVYINNVNDSNNKLIMPVVSSHHWKFFHYDYNNQTSFNYYNPIFDPQGPRKPTKMHENIAKKIIRSAGFNNRLECECPIIPEALRQNDNFQCAVYVCVDIEAIVEEKPLEEIALNFNINHARARMKAVFEYIHQYGTFPAELFFNFLNDGSQSHNNTATKSNKETVKSNDTNTAISNKGQLNNKQSSLTKNALRIQKNRGKMTAEEKESQKARDALRKKQTRGKLTGEEKEAQKLKDRERKAKQRAEKKLQHLSESEIAAHKNKKNLEQEAYRKLMTPQERAKERAQARSRMKKIRDIKKQSGQGLTDAQKEMHAAAQRRYFSRLQQGNYDGQQLQRRIKKILKLLNDLNNSKSSEKLNSEIQKLKLLTPNQYANIRQLYHRHRNGPASILYKIRKLKEVRRHIDAVQKVNRFINSLLDKKDAAEKVKTYAELGILLKIREANMPKNEDEEILQFQRAQYTCKKINSMKEIATEALVNVQKKLNKQINAKIKEVENENFDDYVIRVIGRISYHLKQRGESDEGFESLDDLYPELYKKFMGEDLNVKENNENDKNVVQTEVEDNDVLKSDTSNNYDQNIPTDDGVIDVVQEISERAAETDDKATKSVINNAIEEELMEDDELKENAGPLAGSLLKIITKIKPCCDTCPKFTAAQAKVIQNTFKFLCCQTGDALYKAVKIVMEDKNDDFNSTIFDGLKKYAPCKTGIRTILRRFTEIKNYVNFLQRVKAAYDSCNYEELCKIGNYEDVPRCIMLANSAVYFDYIEELTQDNAYKRFGKNIAAFRKAIAENEVESCNICDQLNFPTKLKPIKYKDAEPFLTEKQKELFKTKEVKRCSKCWDQIKLGHMPAGALANGFDVDPILEIEEKLNWIERSLCQLVRPVQSIICLKDVMNRRTNIKGKTGALVILPVPTENTINHLVNTLPSAESLTIMVNTSVGKTLVRLPLVIEYLQYLKANNKLYENIEINDKFSFDGENNLIFDKPPTKQQIEALVTSNNNDPHLLTQNDIEIQPVGNVDDEAPNGTAYDQYALLKNPFSPVDVNDKNVDAKAFSGLHVHGNYGMHHDRQKKVTERMYVRNRLRSKHRRFATNANWLCFQQGRLEMKDISSSIATQARMNKTALTGDKFKQMMEGKDEVLQQCMSTQFSSLRGHKNYWNAVKLDVKAHIALFGPPSWFLTLYPSESDWHEVIDMYNAIHNGMVNKSNIRNYIAQDPYFWCRHFQHRVKSFFKNCLLTPNCPLGEITNYFYRIEYQHRGTEHVHCLLWVKNAPKPGDDEEKIIKYIDERVTASIPDPVTQAELHDLVIRLQKHYSTCSPTCRRLFKSRGKTYSRCRFEFPRPAIGRTRINKNISPLLGYIGGKTKYYSVKRKEGDEQYINEYSPELLLAWRGNMDLQFLSADLLDIVNYVTGYTTKGESAKSENLFDAMKGKHISKRDKFRIYTSMLKQREMGVMEIVDLLMGHEMYRFNCGHIFINTNAEDKRHRILKPKSLLKKDEPAFLMNWYDNYFPDRPDIFENFCLLNMMIHFQVKNTTASSVKKGDENEEESEGDDQARDADPLKTCKNNPFLDIFHIFDRLSPFYGHGDQKAPSGYKFKTLIGKLLVQHKAQVPRIYWPKLEANNIEAREDYFRRLIMLFVPWRKEAELKGGFDSYEERWENFMENLQKQSENAYNDIKKIIRNQTMQLEMDQEVYNKRKEFKKALKLAKIDDEPEDDLEVFEREVDEDKHEAAKGIMNDGQRKIFNEIVKHILNQQTDKALESIKLFITGTAGTGKSYLINLLADELTLLYTDKTSQATRPAVLLAAPTGLAAIQIKGSTIHSLFNIGVQHGRESKVTTVSKDKLNLKRLLLSNVKLIIIDEISMVSNILLAKMHLRLCQFMGNNEPFGGINVIVLGDLLQLSPVMAPEIFEPLTAHHVKNIFDSSISDFTFWELFQYRELTENKRQEESLKFAELLGRMRIEGLTKEDHEELRARIISTPDGSLPTVTQLAEKYVEIREKDPAVMALFALQDEVTMFNKEVTKLLNLNTVLIEAEDTEIRTKKNSATSKTSRIYQKAEYSLAGKPTARRKRTSRFTKNQTETIEKDDQRASAGLAKKLYLAENCRIMLRRNVNPSIGLVNGATGVLQRIEYINDTPCRLHIKFDNIDEVQVIDKASAVFDVNIEEQRCRRQFPVVMAFAATIHKAQGLTLKNIIISMESIFTGGQAFVAFSRVISLEGLHLADYHPSKIYVNKSCLVHYNHLRKAIGLPEYAMPPEKVVNKDEEQQQQKKRISRKRPSQGNVLIIPHQPKKPKTEKNVKFDDSAMDVDQNILQHTDLNGMPLMQLNNRLDDCFLIAALNFLHCITPVAQYLTSDEYNINNPLINEVRALFRNYTLNASVERIRNLLIARLRSGHQDALTAFDNIIDAINRIDNDEILKPMHIEYSKTKRCQCGAVTSQRCTTKTVGFTVNRNDHFPANIRNLTFDQFFSIWLQTTKTCNNCHNIKLSTKRLFNPNNESLTFICITVDGYTTLPNGNTVMRNLNVSGLNTEVTMFEFRWLLIAAVEKTGNHYVTWVKGDGHWKIIDDSTIRERKMIRRNISCYRMLLFQRMDDN